MLRSIFNDKVVHQKEIDFNYSIKGEMDKIGRIVTTNFQSHNSEHSSSESKKRYRHLIEMLHLQYILAELDDRLSKIDDLLDDIRENNLLIRQGFILLKDDGIDGMRTYLSEQNIDTHNLTDDEIRKATQEFVGDTIDEQQELQDALEKELIEFEQNVDGLDHNSEEYHNYKAELDGRRSELQKIATQQNLNYEQAEKYLQLNNNEANRILKNERSGNTLKDSDIQSNNSSDTDLYEQLEDDRFNDPSQRETKLFSPIGLN